jgi:hypothetical protein
VHCSAARRLLFLRPAGMNTLSNQNFGLIIAYLLPGFVSLWGVGYFSPTVEGWINVQQQPGSPAVAGFMFAALAKGWMPSSRTPKTPMRTRRRLGLDESPDDRGSSFRNSGSTGGANSPWRHRCLGSPAAGSLGRGPSRAPA